MMETFTGAVSEWNTILSQLPQPHFLQTWEWGQVKAAYGWTPMPFIWKRRNGDQESVVAAAMVLKRTVLSRSFAARLCILYLPKGPLLDWTNVALYKQVLDDLQLFAKKQGAIFLKFDPDVVTGSGIPRETGAIEDSQGRRVLSELQQRGWVFSTDQIQFRNSVLIDITVTFDQMLARMKQKTRYNIHLAEKKGVVVRVGMLEDQELLYRMYAETSVRDGFVIRDEGYYRTVWETFRKKSDSNDQPFAEPLIAEVDHQPIAAIVVFYFAGHAYYIYGMSREAHREKMPNYLLQWEAMKRVKARGCSVYDLWGAPDEFDETDPMWGVFRFKEGLGGEVIRTLGAWDYPSSHLWYKTYTNIIPRVLNVLRAKGKARTRQILE